MPEKDKKLHSRSRRRKERAHVHQRLRGVFLKCPDLADADLRVVNVSEFGIGVESRTIRMKTKENSVYPARLQMGRTVAPLQVRVVHVSPELTGMEFVDPSDILKGMIVTFFEAELAGASLRLVTSTEAGSSSGRRRRYENGVGNSLDYTEDQEQLACFEIEIFGNRIKWKRGQALAVCQNGTLHVLSETLRRQLVEFVKSAEAVEPHAKGFIEVILKGG